ncbi:hypothetical protein UFOVP766_32 [uncultured Caudovirales phage]|uniref:Uncharacterized protein n=1 Tax=uncultured Caudovirales phage TaxID=2100421 RepID=A0A6J5P0X3_9CAUD|nr:hypothetical protein UFOVP766_32 [uncultured Caudovirales phage]
MTRDEIVRMAEKAAIMPPNWGATENQWRTLHDFAALVAAAEREACAKVCEDFYQGLPPKLTVRGYLEDMAKAIRARGQK